MLRKGKMFVAFELRESLVTEGLISGEAKGHQLRHENVSAIDANLLELFVVLALFAALYNRPCRKIFGAPIIEVHNSCKPTIPGGVIARVYCKDLSWRLTMPPCQLTKRPIDTTMLGWTKVKQDQLRCIW